MVVALAGLLIALASPPATPRVELTWRAPAPCPSVDHVHQRLRELLPAPPPGPLVRVEADTARRAGTGWRLQLVLRGAQLDDRRLIEARDCRSLADVTALLIALAVAPEEVATRIAASGTPGQPPGPATRADAPPGGVPEPATRADAPPGLPGSPVPASTRAGAPPRSAPGVPAAPVDASARADAPPTGTPGPSADPTNVSDAPPPGGPRISGAPMDGPTRAGAPPRGFDLPAAPPPGGRLGSPADDPALDAPAPAALTPRPPVRAAVRLAGGGEIGGIPAFSPAAGLALGLFRGPWRVELAGTYAARALAYPEPAEVGARVRVATGAVRGCGVPRWRRLEFPVCAGLELGYVHAVARGVADPRPAGDLWLAAQLSPGLAWAPTRVLALTLGLDILVALRRPGFHVAGLGELARSQPVGLRPMLGIEARFP
ncbi:hypothetical protein OV090_01745 [Nannocystis sp. RBIL2]|uniref:hypothetical protein n=1 Tax=Nannocystis sp. RBIL2 TaxID=2996788 RepID=UPI0022707B48|nr:hypothetical protein [Nannocystis sp. RBIL2]MCY1063464.1 hypothetical protein [Nannocystis sp. RBIL2]